MNAGLPEVTELDASLPEQLEDRQARLAKLVVELWAQHHHAIETRRRINKKLAEET